MLRYPSCSRLDRYNLRVCQTWAADEQIVQVMDDFMLQAGNLMPTGGGGPDSDALALMLARQLKPE